MSESALRTARFADTRWSIAILKPLEQEQSWLHDLERAGWLAIFSNQPSSPGDKLPPVDELREEKGHIFTIKIKRGLSGFVNGSRTSALPDTGASENVVSVAFAEERQLEIKNNPTRFRLGNSKVTQSIGNKISFAPIASRDRITY